MAISEIEGFARTYTDHQRHRIEPVYPRGDQDDNADFRYEVIAFVCDSPGEVPVELIRDLFLSEAQWAGYMQELPRRFAQLGELLLSRGGTQHHDAFFTGWLATMDTFGECTRMRLDVETSTALLEAVDRRLRTAQTQPGKLRVAKQVAERLQAAAKGLSGAAPREDTAAESSQPERSRFKRLLSGLRFKG